MVVYVRPTTITQVVNFKQYGRERTKEITLHILLNDVDCLKVNPFNKAKVIVWYRFAKTNDFHSALGRFYKQGGGVVLVCNTAIRKIEGDCLKCDEDIKEKLDKDKDKHVLMFKVDEF